MSKTKVPNQYIAQKKQKKKSALKAVWLIVALAVVFIVIVVKFALSGDDVNTMFTGMPSNDEVYAMAKQFVQPTLKGTGASFSDDGYQFGKQQDSVFVIRSVAETKDNAGDIQKTNFEVTLKYKGGAVGNQNSWEMLNINED